MASKNRCEISQIGQFGMNPVENLLGIAAPPQVGTFVPPSVIEVCEKLVIAGFTAVIVGGAVRDSMMHRIPHDWDVATDALPGSVMRVFTKTVPTGIAHGTVTVITQDEHIEVTTFRSEGIYNDARRPSSVKFGVSLYEDLSRRDLTVNAIAFDPLKNIIYDPFHGARDIHTQTIKAVGEAVHRFTEDGLRVMRAVRLAAQLNFSIDRDTQDAINPSLPSLAKVSVERIRDELCKLLVSPGRIYGLEVAFHTGIMELILPEIMIHDPGISYDEEEWLMARVSAAPPHIRVVALFAGMDIPRAQEVLRRLKFSNAEVEHAVALIAIAHPYAPGCEARTPSIKHVRSLLSRVGLRRRVIDAVDLWQAQANTHYSYADIAEVGRKIIAENHPLFVNELAISGGALMNELGLSPGPIIGKVISQLMNTVINDPVNNQRQTLIDTAREFIDQSANCQKSNQAE